MTLGCSSGNELVRIRKEKEFRIEFPSAPARHFSSSPNDGSSSPTYQQSTIVHAPAGCPLQGGPPHSRLSLAGLPAAT